jgi:septum site-determining protein MinD
MAARILTITSGKGGVGNTTLAANLSAALAIQGQRVVAIDADIGLRNLDVVMGLENRIVYDLVDVVEGRCRLRQAMVRDKRLSELYLLPAAQTRDKNAVNPEQMIELCDGLRQDFDFVILDSPAGIEQGFRNAVGPADEVIIITTPEMSAVRDADRIVGLLEASEKEVMSLVVNRIRPEMVRREDMLSIDDVLDVLAIDLLGIIPEDDKIIVSTNRGHPLAMDNHSLAGQAFNNIAGRVMGRDIPLMSLDKENVFTRIKRFFGT